MILFCVICAMLCYTMLYFTCGDPSGWNLLNTHKVPFVKMWSKHLVPVPKDWGPHVDVAGFFFDNKPKTALHCTAAGQDEVKEGGSGSGSGGGGGSGGGRAQHRMNTHTTSVTPSHSHSHSQGHGRSEHSLAVSTSTSTSTSSLPPPPLIAPDTRSQTSAYEPPEALRAFLQAGPPPVFVGFGSMVVEDAASLIQVR